MVDRGHSKKPAWKDRKIRPLMCLMFSLLGTYAWGEGKKRTGEEIGPRTSGLGRGRWERKKLQRKDNELGDVQMGLRNRTGVEDGRERTMKTALLTILA